MKETIVESLLLVAVQLWYKDSKYVRALIIAVMTALFRLPYVPLIGLLLALKYLRPISPRILVLGTFIVLILVPPFYWTNQPGTTGTVYSLVHANVWTKKVLGPIVGLLQPTPLSVRSDPITSSFYTIYSFIYLPMLMAAFLWVIVSRKTNPFVVGAAIINILISYFTLGTVGTKARYFAPFFVFMIIGYLQTRAELRRDLKAILGLVGPTPYRSKRALRGTQAHADSSLASGINDADTP
jgi:hypothetical protein